MMALTTIACGGPGGTIQISWEESADRIWLGPELWANRLADWRLHNGRLECVESRPNRPIRTVHLLSRSLSSEPREFTMRVLTGPVDMGPTVPESAWAGFLIGAGGEHVDYRLTALTHQRPAEDGGLLALVDGSGQVSFSDNAGEAMGGDLWSIGGTLRTDEVSGLEPVSRTGEGLDDSIFESVLLELSGQETDGDYGLTLTASEAKTGRVLSRAVLDDVPPGGVDGGIALVSHLGPTGSSSGFWFQDWEIAGGRVRAHPDRVFGPVLGVQYTVSRGILKLTAQMGPLGPDDTRAAELQVREDGYGRWSTAAVGDFVEDSCTIPFRVENWDSSLDVPYRIVYELKMGSGESSRNTYEGMIRAEPEDRDFVVAAFTGHKIYTGDLKWNHSGIWFPHNEVISAVVAHDPDLLFFSGDQVYEGDLTPAERAPHEKAMLDYLYKWYRWCWAFEGLTRSIPAVTIPDDHDVYHGNIWGAGGRKAEAREGMTAQDSGGYRMSPRFVNAVHRTQTSHLPDPHDPTPVEQGISVYYTDLTWGGVSFAVLADRQWKSSPTVMVPPGRFVNGWPQEIGFDASREADREGAVLLGQRQLGFLREWAADWSGGTWMKAVLSQTILANVATIPRDATSGSIVPSLPILAPGAYPDDYKKATDGDSNGWPQSGRNRALREIRKGFAVHIAGDQHLGTTIQYGIDEWHDAGYAFCVPSVGNTWPRRWFPPEPGMNRLPGAPRYTGDFYDGFGNRITVHAVSNPHQTGMEPSNLHDRAPGYGIVRFDRETREITIECWPRYADPTDPDAPQYPGWPVHLNQMDNYPRSPAGYLPRLEVTGMESPVIQVIDESTGEIEYTLRIRGTTWQPIVFREGIYTIRVGEPGTDRLRSLEHLPSIERAEQAETLKVELVPGRI
jgi:hypothetical protein